MKKIMLTYHESSIKPPIFRGWKLIPPSVLSLPPPLPSLFLFFTNKCWTVLINHNCKTSYGLIRDGIFTSWKFGFVFDPWLHDLQGLVLKLSTFYSNPVFTSPTIKVRDHGKWHKVSSWVVAIHFTKCNGSLCFISGINGCWWEVR